MSKKAPHLKSILKQQDKTSLRSEENLGHQIDELQKLAERIQQAVFLKKERVIVAIEGFDAAGKGGAIRRLTHLMDPRGVTVHPIGPPTEEEQGRHWLYRFWTKLPAPGTIAVFDRTWYGRVLVERVELGLSNHDTLRSFEEIKEFERTLVKNGIRLIKIFLAVSAEEQKKRFDARLADPFKRWKIGPADIRSRLKRKDYVEAADIAIRETHTQDTPWLVLPADDKHQVRLNVLEHFIDGLHDLEKWLKNHVTNFKVVKLKKYEKELGL